MARFQEVAAAVTAAVAIFVVAHAARPITAITPVGPYEFHSNINCNRTCGLGKPGFCGVDDQCHQYSCQRWYELGPRNYTGYDDATAMPLECQDISLTSYYNIDIGRNWKLPSVTFRCRSLSSPPIDMGFTRRCSTPNNDFTCYELAESTDFQPFLNEASASGLTCADEEYDETGYPKFLYHAAYTYTGRPYGQTVLTPGHNGTSEFNETLALTGTMYASYKESTGQPTASPVESPTSSPIVTSFAFSNERQIIITVGSLLGVSFLVSSAF